MEEKIAILVLGAGSSSRFKQPKQLLEYKDKTLIELASQTAVDTYLGPVYVVLGSDHKKVEEKLRKFEDKIEVIINKRWEKGISESIKSGIDKIRKDHPDIYGVIIMLTDQPLISVNHLINIARSHFSSGKNIIASGYGGSFGVPAFFHNSLFNYFDKLEGDTGAKSIISNLKRDVHVIPNPEAELDIDTKEDYQELLKKE